MRFTTSFAALAALTAISACDPVVAPGCQPGYDASGQQVTGCTADGQPVAVTAPAPTGVAATHPPAFGPVPVLVGATGEPMPPIPATLTPIDPNARVIAQTQPAPATR